MDIEQDISVETMNQKTDRIDVEFVTDSGKKHTGKLTRILYEGEYYFGLLGVVSILLNKKLSGPYCNVENLCTTLRNIVEHCGMIPLKEMILEGNKHSFSGLGSKQNFVLGTTIEQILNSQFKVSSDTFKEQFLKPNKELSSIINKVLKNKDDSSSPLNNTLNTITQSVSNVLGVHNNPLHNHLHNLPNTFSSYDTLQQVAVPITLFNQMKDEIKSAERIMNQLVLLCTMNGVDTSPIMRSSLHLT